MGVAVREGLRRKSPVYRRDRSPAAKRIWAAPRMCPEGKASSVMPPAWKGVS